MQVKLESSFTDSCKILFEHNLAIGGYTYLVIFGKHINGAFICIPNHKWGCEASDLPGSVGYNQDKLMAIGCPEDVALLIARYIDNYLHGSSTIVE